MGRHHVLSVGHDDGMSLTPPRIRQFLPPVRSAAQDAQRTAELRAARRRFEAERAARIEASRALMSRLGDELTDLPAAASCFCGCHPRPGSPESGHAQRDCVCQMSDEQRAAHRAELFDALASFETDWDDDAEQAALAQAAGRLGVTATWRSHFAPMVITGVCDGRAYYLRARHGEYRVTVASLSGPLLGDGDLCDVPPDQPTIDIAEGSDEFADEPTRALEAAVGAVRIYLHRVACPHEQAATDEHQWCSRCGILLAEQNLWSEPLPR